MNMWGRHDTAKYCTSASQITTIWDTSTTVHLVHPMWHLSVLKTAYNLDVTLNMIGNINWETHRDQETALLISMMTWDKTNNPGKQITYGVCSRPLVLSFQGVKIISLFPLILHMATAECNCWKYDIALNFNPHKCDPTGKFNDLLNWKHIAYKERYVFVHLRSSVTEALTKQQDDVT